MSNVPAHWELIPEIVQLRDEVAPETLLTINGDIADRKQGEQLAQQYHVDGIMIGRGIFHNPFAFEKDKQSHSYEALLQLLLMQLDLHDYYSRVLEPRRFDPLKRFFKIYAREFRSSRQLKARLMETKTTDEARAVVHDFMNQQGQQTLLKS